MKRTVLLMTVLLYAIVLQNNKIAAQWLQTKGPYGGIVTCFTETSGGILGENLIMGTSSGVYFSTNNGQNWNDITKSDYLYEITALASDGNELFAGTDYCVLNCSTNGFVYQTNLVDVNVTSIAMSGGNVYVGTLDKGVYLSTDHGENWNQVNNGFENLKILSLCAIGDNIFAGTDNGLYKSSSYEINWVRVEDNRLSNATITNLVSNEYYVMAVSGQYLFISSDYGKTWKEILLPGLIVSITQSGNNLFVATKDRSIFKSTIGKEYWTRVNTGFTNYKITAIHASGTNLFAGTWWGGVYRSTNNGINWSESNSGFSATEISCLLLSGTNLFAGAQFFGVFSLEKGKSEWSRSSTGLEYGRDITSLIAHGKDLLAGTYGDVYLSSNNGLNWTLISSGLPDFRKINTLVYSGQNLFAGIDGGGIYVSTNNGREWIERNNGLSNLYITLLAVSGNNIYAGTSGGKGEVYLSTDQGQNWRFAGQTNASIKSLYVFGNNLFAGTLVGVYRSSDNGKSWRAAGLNQQIVYALASSGTTLFAGCYGGVSISTDNGENWSHVGLIDYGATCFAIDGTDIYVGTLNHEVWHRPLSEMISTKNPVIIIPGIMASPLYDDKNWDNKLHRSFWSELSNEVIWVNASEQFFLRYYLDPLLLKEDGVTSIDPKYNIKVAPLRNDKENDLEKELTYPPLDHYKDLFDYLKNSSNYKIDNCDYNTQEGENLYCFTYDWRKSNDINALKLSAFIDSVKKWNNCSQVNIIAHSMGGIVAKKYIAMAGPDNINKLIFIGTPHLGAPEILLALANGKLLGLLSWITYESEIKRLSRNMYSAHELIPSKLYNDFSIKNDHTKLNLDLYQSCLASKDDENMDHDQMMTFYKEFVFKDGSTFNKDLLDRSDEFRTSIEDVNFGSIKVYNIVGYNNATMDKVSFDGDDVEYSMKLNGDGTVPLRSAEIISKSRKLADKTFYIKDIAHPSLPESEPVLEIIGGLLSEPAVESGFPSEESKIFYEPPESYAISGYVAGKLNGPAVLNAYDLYKKHTGPLTDSTWEENIPGSKYIPCFLKDPNSDKAIFLPSDGTYTFTINSQGTTGYISFNIEKVFGGATNLSCKFSNISIQPKTVAECLILPGPQIITMKIDYDGDGTVDKVIFPVMTAEAKNEDKGKVPQIYSLSQNYPNPFNPVTNISYSLPESRNVKIRIFDMLGNEIVTLVNEYKSPGYYSIQFDGSKFPSGIYIYRMEAGEYISSKKLILIK